MGDGGRHLREARSLGRGREPVLCRAKRVLNLCLILDIDIDPVPLDDAAIIVAQWLCASVDPAVHTVGSANAMAEGKRPAGSEGMSQELLQGRPVIRMDHGANCFHEPLAARLIK